MSDPLAKIDDDSMVRWGNVRFEFGRLQYELNVALTELARLTPAPGCSLVVSVGVDGTTSTHPVERQTCSECRGEGDICWEGGVLTDPGTGNKLHVADQWHVCRRCGGTGTTGWVAVPVRDPQEPHDG
jgi:hypothetical protein